MFFFQNDRTLDKEKEDVLETWGTIVAEVEKKCSNYTRQNQVCKIFT